MPHRRAHAFSLVELIAVVAVVGLRAAAAVVRLDAVKVHAHDDVASVQVRQLLLAADAYRMLRDASPTYDPSDALLTTTYYGQAAEELSAHRRPDVVAASTSPTEVSFAVSQDGRLLGAAVRSASGRCVHGVGAADGDPDVVLLDGVEECRAFVSGFSDDPEITDATASPGCLNRSPFATDDVATVAEDTPVVVDVLANDYDLDGDAIRVAGVADAAGGTAELTDSGQVSYIPHANVHGEDTFAYDIVDGRGARATARVTVTVTAVNDVPVAVDDHAATAQDVPVTVDVLEDDVDADGDPLALSIASGPGSGTARVTADRHVDYTPAAGFTGSDTLTYQVDDGHGGVATAAVTVTVTDANVAPAAADDATTTSEDVPVTLDVTANDRDADGDPLQVVAVTQPLHGRAVLDSHGQVSYYPAADWSGADAFAYEIADGRGGQDTAVVSVEVAAVNDAPVARTDAVTVVQDRPVSVVVLDNDTDADGDPLAVTDASTARVDPAGTVTYTPAAGFTGTDTLIYAIADPEGESATATVAVTVLPADDTMTVCLSPDTDDERSAVVAADTADTYVADGAHYGLCGHHDHGEDPDGVTICHQPGTPAQKTLTVPQPAVRGHVRHGDYVGSCPGGGE